MPVPAALFPSMTTGEMVIVGVLEGGVSLGSAEITTGGIVNAGVPAGTSPGVSTMGGGGCSSGLVADGTTMMTGSVVITGGWLAWLSMALFS